jgi:dihydroorotate dehydrogenase
MQRERFSQNSELDFKEKIKMLRGMLNPDYFNKKVRPFLYSRAGGDAEAVHNLTLEILDRYSTSIGFLSPFFSTSGALKVKIHGKEIVPFGTAAGMDKNGDALRSLSSIYGFQESGTVVLESRSGNTGLRVAVAGDRDLANAQGFPSKGLSYFFDKISSYRDSGGNGIIYASICGLPLSEVNAVQTAQNEIITLASKLKDYVDGFVWNPFSPNTEALNLLRTTDVFKNTAAIISGIAPDKPRLVKIGPYGESGKRQTLDLVGSFLDGGGNGVVTTNTKMVLKEELPDDLKFKWGYKSAGLSGAYLRHYRNWSVRDIRSEFPNSIIIATGGIFSGEEAYETFKAGANALEGFTPYTFLGPGLLREMKRKVESLLYADDFPHLQEMQDSIKANIQGQRRYSASS